MSALPNGYPTAYRGRVSPPGIGFQRFPGWGGQLPSPANDNLPLSKGRFSGLRAGLRVISRINPLFWVGLTAAEFIFNYQFGRAWIGEGWTLDHECDYGGTPARDLFEPESGYRSYGTTTISCDVARGAPFSSPWETVPTAHDMVEIQGTHPSISSFYPSLEWYSRDVSTEGIGVGTVILPEYHKYFHIIPAWSEPMAPMPGQPMGPAERPPVRPQRWKERKKAHRLRPQSRQIGPRAAYVPYYQASPALRHEWATGVEVDRGRSLRSRNVTASRVRPAQKPGRGTKERKWILGTQGTVAGWLFNVVTETGDFVEAIYFALPKKYWRKSDNLAERAIKIYQHADEIDASKAIQGLIQNQVIDFVGGQIGKATAGANRRLGHAAGISLGPAL